MCLPAAAVQQHRGPFFCPTPPPRCRLATRLVCGTAPLSSSVGSVLRLQDRACFSTARGVKLMCSGVLVARRAWQAASGDRRPPSPRADGGLSRHVLRRSMACRRMQLLPSSTVRRPERRLCAPVAHDDRTGRGPDRRGLKSSCCSRSPSEAVAHQHFPRSESRGNARGCRRCVRTTRRADQKAGGGRFAFVQLVFLNTTKDKETRPSTGPCGLSFQYFSTGLGLGDSPDSPREPRRARGAIGRV